MGKPESKAALMFSTEEDASLALKFVDNFLVAAMEERPQDKTKIPLTNAIQDCVCSDLLKSNRFPAIKFENKDLAVSPVRQRAIMASRDAAIQNLSSTTNSVRNRLILWTGDLLSVSTQHDIC